MPCRLPSSCRDTPVLSLGSAGSLPAVFDSLPNPIFVGTLPTNAGWQPDLPKPAKETAPGGKHGTRCRQDPAFVRPGPCAPCSYPCPAGQTPLVKSHPKCVVHFQISDLCPS